MAQRGKHPKDHSLFDQQHHDTMRRAAADLHWLLTRDYALTASVGLVGDRYQLRERQRLAIGRATASQEKLESRFARKLSADQLAGQEVWIDTFNLLLTLEAYVGGGVLLRCQDQTMRDMSSVHGTYRKVDQTQFVIASVIAWFHQRLQVHALRWLIDSPVSNSGRLKAAIESEYAQQSQWESSVELVPNPDVLLIGCRAVVVSTDSVILDKCHRWSNAAAEIIDALDSPLIPSNDSSDRPIIISF